MIQLGCKMFRFLSGHMQESACSEPENIYDKKNLYAMHYCQSLWRVNKHLTFSEWHFHCTPTLSQWAGLRLNNKKNADKNGPKNSVHLLFSIIPDNERRKQEGTLEQIMEINLSLSGETYLVIFTLQHFSSAVTHLQIRHTFLIQEVLFFLSASA